MYRRVWYNTMTYLTGCKHLIERFPRTAVPIIPLERNHSLRSGKMPFSPTIPFIIASV